MNPITVDGVTIPTEAIAREAQHHDASTPQQAWAEAARALTVRQLMLREAERQSIACEPMLDAEGRLESSEDALIRVLVDRAVTVQDADEATCRSYYEEHQRRFRAPDRFEAAHILLPVAPDDKPGREAAKSRARAILAELARAPERFADLARAHSACPSRSAGGDLGRIGPGQTVAEFEAVLNTMAQAGPPELVESRYGVHIVRLDRRIPGDRLAFEIVHDRIRAYLGERARHQALHTYVAMLARNAVIAGIDLMPRH